MFSNTNSCGHGAFLLSVRGRSEAVDLLSVSGVRWPDRTSDQQQVHVQATSKQVPDCSFNWLIDANPHKKKCTIASKTQNFSECCQRKFFLKKFMTFLWGDHAINLLNSWVGGSGQKGKTASQSTGGVSFSNNGEMAQLLRIFPALAGVWSLILSTCISWLTTP